jgi:SAM-dependent MidA family methyltransferase
MAENDLPLDARLARAITLGGPISIAQFMAAANAAYYGSRDPLGVDGDFITAPEISQMFGELIGLWGADLWQRAGQPPLHYVELGPGRGTLAHDALRAMKNGGLAPQPHFVETSPALREVQASRVAGVVFHADASTLPTGAPLLVIANEFFDALPIQQVVKADSGWHQRLVACQDTLFLPIVGKRVPEDVIPEALRAAPIGSVLESSPAAVAIVDALAARLRTQGGALLIIDYGYTGPAIGDTLQALRHHRYANPFDAIGQQDLTAHIDFGTLAAAGQRAGLRVSPLTNQGRWLEQLGIRQRLAKLTADHPDKAGDLRAAVARLTAADQMGQLFSVVAMTAPDWPEPSGF